MTDDLAAALVEAGLEVVTFSISGGEPEVHRRNRPGSDLKRVLDAVRMVRQAKRRAGTGSPLIASSYELTRNGMETLSRAVHSLKSAGVERLIAIHPILTLTREQRGNLILDIEDPGERESMLRSLRRAAAATMMRSLSFDYEPVEPVPGAACREDPVHSLFVSATGDVAPCAFLGVPVVGEGTPWRRFSMGSLHRQNLREIWNSPAYIDFRRGHSGEGPLPEPCRNCPRARGY
jgi:radical SAM protein with 4Fe4S-binding SPASM domain